MIGYINGKLIYIKGNELIIDVNGLGYSVEVTSIEKFQTVGNKVELYIYTYVREDRISLYGFNSMEEKEIFTILLGVSGIGPKAAVNILSELSTESFVQAIMSENLAVLKQVSGIGPKTAQRLVLELKSKLQDLSYEPSVKITAEPGSNDEIIEALVNLGYTQREINNALSKIKLDNEDEFEDHLKKILQHMGNDS